jgi:TDG/mug DNA glycosylase family protein
LKQEKITDHVTVKKKRKVDRFKGMPEEEVITRLLPDHLAPNLDIVIVSETF